MRMIRAGSERAMRSARRQMEGGVSAFVREAREAIIEVLASLSAAVDFPDEVEETLVSAQVSERCAAIAARLRDACDPRAGRIEDEGLRVVLAGRPNAGKSTLLNALSGADVLAEDRLFATLDPVMRQVELPDNRSCLLVDTVGFIKKLPHELVEAFKSTLEEALYADLIVVVSDVSSPQCAEQRTVVFDVLNSLGAADRPVLEVLNKADRIDAEGVIEPADAVLISARDGMGLDRLKQAISDRIAEQRHRVEVVIPYHRGALLSQIHDQGVVISEEYLAEGTKVICEMDGTLYARVMKQLEG